ncbi:Vanillin dehydrogenase [Fusarium oxysporum f. sp. phaseoli]
MILSFRYRLPHFVNSTEALSETMTDSAIDQSVLHNGSQGYRVPLLINDAPILREDDTSQHHSFEGGYFQGADLSDCADAVSSCSKAFVTWSTTSPTHRRGLLLRLAQVLKNHQQEVRNIMKSEIYCDDEWASIGVNTSIDLIEQSAYLLTAGTMSGTIPHTQPEGSYGLVFTRPLGVVLGIAPWNSPLFLALRAVIAPLATGNTVILKGSELSPRTHYFVAGLFAKAGFPPGVVNFILHRPEDAPEVVGYLIRDPAVRKVNFTGSTQVGRTIAQQAGLALKPVLLELGGKNCCIVLKDADIDRAAEAALAGATLNVSLLSTTSGHSLINFVHKGGQICMSTDLVLVEKDVVDEFRAELTKHLRSKNGSAYRLVGLKSQSRVQALVSDAEAKGSSAKSSTEHQADSNLIPITILDNIHSSMDFFRTETFGPCLGIVAVSNEDEAVKIVNDSDYGLSAAIWTRNQYAALEMARRLQVGAVHINSSTVHDEATLPHGGTKLSGFGRFGAEWGLKEFVETQTVIMHA